MKSRLSVIAVALTFIMTGVAFGGHAKSNPPKTADVIIHKPVPQIPASWKTYRNAKYGFQLKMPSDTIVKERFAATPQWKDLHLAADMWLMENNNITPMLEGPTISAIPNPSKMPLGKQRVPRPSTVYGKPQMVRFSDGRTALMIPFKRYAGKTLAAYYTDWYFTWGEYTYSFWYEEREAYGREKSEIPAYERRAKIIEQMVATFRPITPKD